MIPTKKEVEEAIRILTVYNEYGLVETTDFGKCEDSMVLLNKLGSAYISGELVRKPSEGEIFNQMRKSKIFHNSLQQFLKYGDGKTSTFEKPWFYLACEILKLLEEEK